MKVLVDRTVALLDQVAKATKPKNEDQADAEEKFRIGKDKKAKKIFKLTGTLTPHSDYYLDQNENFYYFIYGNQLKGKGKAEQLAKQCIKNFLRHYEKWLPLYNTGQLITIGYILWLQAEVLYLSQIEKYYII